MQHRELALIAAAVALLFPATASAQKKAMDHDVYDTWQKVENTKITNDGSVIVWEVNAQEGDGNLYVRKAVQNSKSKQVRDLCIPRGFNTSLDPQGRWLYLRIKPAYAVTRKEKIDKKKNEDKAKDTLAIVNLADLSMKKYGAVDAYTTGSKAMPYIAYKSSWKEYKDSTDKKGTVKSGFIVMDPATEHADTLKYIDGYSFTPDGDMLLLTSKKEKKDTTSATAVMFVPKLFSLNGKAYQKGKPNFTKIDTIVTGAEAYKVPSFNDAMNKMVFTGTKDTSKNRNKKYAMYLTDITWPATSKGKAKQASNDLKYDTKEIIAEGTTASGTDSWTLNENSGFYFTPDDKRIITSIGTIRPPKDSTIVDFESAQLDIWRWDSPYTPPQERLNNSKVLSKTYTAVVNLDKPGTIVPIARTYEESIRLLNGGRSDWALSRDNSKYVRESFWEDRNVTDVSLINLNDGSRKTVAKELNHCRFDVSPSGKYLIWFLNDDHCWYTYNTETGTTVNISAQAGVPFYDEEDDHPSKCPMAHEGSPKWLEGEDYVLIIDRYDVWKFAADGSSATCLTGGVGRQTKNRFHMWDTRTDLRTECEKRCGAVTPWSPAATMYLTVQNEDTEKNGFGFFNLEKPSKTLTYFTDTVTYSGMAKAKDAERWIFQKGNFQNCNDLYTTTDFFRASAKATGDISGKAATCEKLSAINPQKEDYRWGHVELFHWTSYDGKPLKGLVFIPDGIKEGEKLPVMCYFYEKYSNQLYSWWTPAPSRSTVNIPLFCSRGYVVFIPDIVYTDGHPGESAYNCICSGCEALCKAYGFADSTKMGIQGQSWGGYQTAFLVTRTNMFAAAGAGAPVSNMTSAYGGIRWGSGMTRAGQYENGQSRIGKTLWDEGGLDLYIENSPIFHADKVTTPLLIMHNDADGAVPWYQGIEYFSDLRRLNKPCWMLEYNKEAHNLVERRNCKDLSRRLTQFFDHYLKGAPMPAWMKTGVRYYEKEEYYGFEDADQNSEKAE